MMKDFKLERFLAGDKVVTRDGEEVTEIYYFKTISHDYPITAIISGEAYSFTKLGENVKGKISHTDLFMAPTKKTGWINIYRSGLKEYEYEASQVFPTKELAEKAGDFAKEACIKIEWEE